MNKLEFNDKLADFLSGLKNYKQTDNKRALELFVGYLKETDGTTPMTKYLAENGKNPHGSLFGYREAKNAMNTGRYLYNKLRDIIEPKYILTYIDDWREEPSLFPAEETSEPPEDKMSQAEKAECMFHMACALDDVSAKLDKLLIKIDKLIELETRAMHHVLASEKLEAEKC